MLDPGLLGKQKKNNSMRMRRTNGCAWDELHPFHCVTSISCRQVCMSYLLSIQVWYDHTASEMVGLQHHLLRHPPAKHWRSKISEKKDTYSCDESYTQFTRVSNVLVKLGK